MFGSCGRLCSYFGLHIGHRLHSRVKDSTSKLSEFVLHIGSDAFALRKTKNSKNKVDFGTVTSTSVWGITCGLRHNGHFFPLNGCCTVTRMEQVVLVIFVTGEGRSQGFYLGFSVDSSKGDFTGMRRRACCCGDVVALITQLGSSNACAEDAVHKFSMHECTVGIAWILSRVYRTRTYIPNRLLVSRLFSESGIIFAHCVRTSVSDGPRFSGWFFA